MGYATQGTEGSWRSHWPSAVTVAAPILAAASAILFILTEDTSLAATLVNAWTPLYAMISLALLAAIGLARPKKRPESYL
jgi:hypothetical protein